MKPSELKEYLTDIINGFNISDEYQFQQTAMEYIVYLDMTRSDFIRYVNMIKCEVDEYKNHPVCGEAVSKYISTMNRILKAI